MEHTRKVTENTPTLRTSGHPFVPTIKKKPAAWPDPPPSLADRLLRQTLRAEPFAECEGINTGRTELVDRLNRLLGVARHVPRGVIGKKKSVIDAAVVCAITILLALRDSIGQHKSQRAGGYEG